MRSHPPQPAGSRSALGPQLCWDGAVPGGCLGFGPVLGAGAGTCRARSPFPPSGNCGSGRGPGRGGGKLFLFLPLFILLPRISWDEPSENMGTHTPDISQPLPSPCRLSSPCVCPHCDSLQPPSIPLALPWPHLSPEQLEKRGDLRSQNPLAAPPFPQPFSLPPCPDSEKGTGWISGQHPALPCSAPAG